MNTPHDDVLERTERSNTAHSEYSTVVRQKEHTRMIAAAKGATFFSKTLLSSEASAAARTHRAAHMHHTLVLKKLRYGLLRKLNIAQISTYSLYFERYKHVQSQPHRQKSNLCYQRIHWIIWWLCRPTDSTSQRTVCYLRAWDPLLIYLQSQMNRSTTHPIHASPDMLQAKSICLSGVYS